MAYPSVLWHWAALVFNADKCYFVGIVPGQRTLLKAMFVIISSLLLNVVNRAYRRRQVLKCQPEMAWNPPQFGKDILCGSLWQTATWSSNCFLASPGFEAKANVNTIKWNSDGGPRRGGWWKVIRRNDITGENKVQWLHLFPLAYYWSTGGKRALSFLFLQ